MTTKDEKYRNTGIWYSVLMLVSGVREVPGSIPGIPLDRSTIEPTVSGGIVIQYSRPTDNM